MNSAPLYYYYLFIIVFILAIKATGFAAIAKYISFLFLLSLSWQQALPRPLENHITLRMGSKQRSRRPQLQPAL